MITVKVSYPSKWDKEWGGPMFLKETPNNAGVWGNYRFEINNDTNECDFWIVYDGINKYLSETAFCPPQNVIFLTGEVVPFWHYPDPFLRQFGKVITARKDIRHPEVHNERHTCVWHVKKNLDYLKSLPPPLKRKNLSTITSSSVFFEGHKLRYAFVNKLKGHFKKDLDWYGKGEKLIDDKWDGLIDYRYSMAIENSVHRGYFTEKIVDCYLAYTLPIYFGCPNIHDYFDPESMIVLDINDYEKSISIIEEAMRLNVYEKKLASLIKMREKILSEISFFPFITNWLDQNCAVSARKRKKVVLSSDYFEKPKTLRQLLYRAKLRSIQYLKGYR